MPLEKTIILNNQLGETIQILLSESPGWKLAGNVVASAEIAVAAVSLAVAVSAASEELAAAAMVAPEAWTIADAVGAMNYSRALKIVSKGSALVMDAVSAADNFLEGIDASTKTIPANTANQQLLSESFWHDILTVDGFADLLGFETIVLTVLTKNTRRALHLKSTLNMTWTINEAGAVDSNGTLHPWDGFVTSAAPPAISVNDSGAMTLFWTKPNSTLGAMDLLFSNWIKRPELSFGPVIDGVGVAYHNGQLYLGYAVPFNGIPHAFSRQGYYKGHLQNGWDGERGTLQNVPVDPRFPADFIGVGGVSMASGTPWPSQPSQLNACFHDTDNTSIVLLTHEENNDSRRRFGHIATVYAPDGSALQSVSCPSICWYQAYLQIAIQQGGATPTIQVYNMMDTIVAKCTSGFTFNVDAFGPTLGVFKGGLYVAYSTPVDGVFIRELSGSNYNVEVKVTSEKPDSLVAFGANDEMIVLAWCTPEGAVVYSLSTNGKTWYGPYPATAFVDPNAPSG